MLKSFYQSNCIEAGLDEAGRGCLAGPVVAAAVILPADFTHPYLTDSKALSVAQRLQVEEVIKQEALAYSVAEVTSEEIDQINILRASFLAMHRAVEELVITPGHLLVDGNRFIPYPMIPHSCIIKGDSLYYSIAAASVLAKNHRDRKMLFLAKEYPQYGWEKNVGYPTKFHRQAILEFGVTPYHRQTFRLLPPPELF